MKYTQKSFSIGGYNKQYSQNWEQTFKQENKEMPRSKQFKVEDNKIYFAHFYILSESQEISDCSSGRATISAQFDTSSKTMMYGLSFCSPKDQFCRKTGRVLAKGRIHKVKKLESWNEVESVSTLLKDSVIQELGEHRDSLVPSWVPSKEDLHVAFCARSKNFKRKQRRQTF